MTAEQWRACAIYLVLPAAVIVALNVGRVDTSLADVWHTVVGQLAGSDEGVSGTVKVVIWDIRTPRVIAAVLVGASLSVSGATFQATFGNPLVSGEILGVTAGAALGAVIAILSTDQVVLIQTLAFLGGVAAVTLTSLIARFQGGGMLSLVLGGVIVTAICSSGLAFLTYAADPLNELPSIVFWLLGSFAGVKHSDLTSAAPLMLLGLIVLISLRWRLNVLAVGDVEARAAGIDASRLRLVVVAAATVASASAVSVSGLVGWVGLLVPHLARPLVGNDHAKVIPVAAALGATYVLIADTVARTLTEAELPLTALTSLVGAPALIVLLRRHFRVYPA